VPANQTVLDLFSAAEGGIFRGGGVKIKIKMPYRRCVTDKIQRMAAKRRFMLAFIRLDLRLIRA
jgi:hypothetical protein